MKEINKHVIAERAHNFDLANFRQLFNNYDEDKNGYIEKSEMGNLIKKTFKKPKAEVDRAKAKNYPPN